MPTPKKRYRLNDILTKEVSMVDRAANRRVWLVAKEDQMPVELLPDGQGGFTTPPVVAPPVAPTAVAPLTVSKATKASLVSAIEKLTAIANSPESDSDAPGIQKALGDALVGFTPEPEPTPAPVLVGKMADNPVELTKALTGAAAKLLEIANGLGIDTDTDAERYPQGLRWKISDVLDCLCSLTSLAEHSPAAAAMVAGAVASAPVDVSKSADPQSADRYRALVVGLQNTLASSVGISDDTQVQKFDDAGAEKLIDSATQVIKAQAAKILELESRTVRSNALPIEGAPVAKSSAGSAWPADMAAPGADIKF